jgi:hypothetical protein
LKIHGPLGNGCSATISLRSTASLSVPGLTPTNARSLGQRHPSFSGTSLARIDRDLMVATQRGDSLLGPEVTPAGSQVIAIEYASNHQIRTDTDELAHGINCFA